MRCPLEVIFGIPGYDDKEGRILTLRFTDVTVINIYHCSLGPHGDPAKRLHLDILFYQYVMKEQQRQKRGGAASLAWRGFAGGVPPGLHLAADLEAV